MLQATYQFLLPVMIMTVKSRTNIPETTNTLFRMINETMTWNEASVDCKSRGGRLLNIFDKIRKIATTTYIKIMTDTGQLSSAFWIGLHNVNGSNLDSVFKWSDCSPITTSYWSNSTQNVGEYCVSANQNDLTWQIRPCTDRLLAVCETSTPCSCQIMRITTECANLVTTVSSLFTGLSEDACKIKCLMHVKSNDQCWALSYDTLTGTCIIHEQLQTTNICIPTYHFYSKICFTYNLPTTRINNTVNNNIYPESICTADETTLPTPDNCNYTLPTTIATPTTEPTCTCCKIGESGLPEFWANITLQQQLDWLVRILKVNKTNTSAMRRRKNSAADTRITATSLGYAGTAILILVVSGIVLLDLSRLRRDITRAFNGLRLYIKK